MKNIDLLSKALEPAAAAPVAPAFDPSKLSDEIVNKVAERVVQILSGQEPDKTPEPEQMPDPEPEAGGGENDAADEPGEMG